jgi:DnaJ-class molecular chaperone
MDFKDYYATLGVAKTATDKEIKQAFRKMARLHHPDVNPGDKAAESRFKEINEAYEVLSHADNRRKYDELGANWRMYEQAGGARGAEPQGPWSAGSGGRPGGFRSMSEDGVHDLFGGGDPFSDFFKTFFGGAGAPQEPGRRARSGRGGAAHQGRDVEHEIELSLEEAYRGVSRRLSIKNDGHARTVEVRIPAGVGDGSRVRVTGEGGHGAGGAPPGDLYLRIRLTPHPVFEKKGHDLHTRVTLPLTTAVLGGETTVQTLDSRTLRLKIPATTQNAQVFRLKGHGMPGVGPNATAGDLYATIEIQLPTRLTSEERAHFEALRTLEAKVSSSSS